MNGLSQKICHQMCVIAICIKTKYKKSNVSRLLENTAHWRFWNKVIMWVLIRNKWKRKYVCVYGKRVRRLNGMLVIRAIIIPFLLQYFYSTCQGKKRNEHFIFLYKMYFFPFSLISFPNRNISELKWCTKFNIFYCCAYHNQISICA